MKSLANPLQPGDVIQTHPLRGFWGCAIVLSARDSTEQFDPTCHIGITTFIAKRKFAWRSIDPKALKIVEFAPAVRVAPNEYYQSKQSRVSIGIYSLKSSAGLSIIGNVDPSLIYDKRLNFDVGDGTNGKFPLCGPINVSLGHEAVIAWRQIHDKERFAQEAAEARIRFEQYEQERLAQARAKRRQGGI